MLLLLYVALNVINCRCISKTIIYVCSTRTHLPEKRKPDNMYSIINCIVRVRAGKHPETTHRDGIICSRARIDRQDI